MPEDWRVANEASHFRNDKGRLQGSAVVTYIEQKDTIERPGEIEGPQLQVDATPDISTYEFMQRLLLAKRERDPQLWRAERKHHLAKGVESKNFVTVILQADNTPDIKKATKPDMIIVELDGNWGQPEAFDTTQAPLVLYDLYYLCRSRTVF
ncbi:hypothetical protein HGM15179_004376 [Zosterops borbonicus]|uniref:Uncharacterized protein n=1 Tax=Zosterops borbonicus TaxID=364589 RepID=A0A8K1GRD9_9PASS|nr:hypothetical protein HGM15179_004376 [Zosterops borbonicus]